VFPPTTIEAVPVTTLSGCCDSKTAAALAEVDVNDQLSPGSPPWNASITWLLAEPVSNPNTVHIIQFSTDRNLTIMRSTKFLAKVERAFSL
jgi:hypothetical protein